MRQSCIKKDLYAKWGTYKKDFASFVPAGTAGSVSGAAAGSDPASGAAASGTAASAASAGFATVEAGKLIMSANASFPPYEMIPDGGGFEGIDMEIAAAIAAKPRLELEIADMDFTSAENLFVKGAGMTDLPGQNTGGAPVAA